MGTKLEFGQQREEIAGYPVWERVWDVSCLRFWDSIGRYVPMVSFNNEGGLQLVQSDEIAYTYGANPCVAFVAIKEDIVWLGHSGGSDLVPHQQLIIEVATGGIVGGGNFSLDMYNNLFVLRYRVFRPPAHIPEAVFNIVVVRKKNSPAPFGIHYGWWKL